MDSYEQFTDGYVLLQINQSVDTRKKIFDMSKNCLTFYGCLRVLTSSYECITDAGVLFTDAYWRFMHNIVSMLGYYEEEQSLNVVTGISSA